MAADTASVPATPQSTPTPSAPTAVDAAVRVLAGGKADRVDFAPVAPEPRPAWLPEKFKSPFDLAQAYTQLEQKLGGGVPQIPTSAPGPIAAPQLQVPASAAPGAPGAPSDLVSRMTQEYAHTGAVSAASREAFEKQYPGLPATFIDNQVSFMKAQETRAMEMATQRLGGEGAIRELTEWAAKRLPDADRQAFNQAVYSDNPAMVQLALDGLAAKYEMEVGRSPKIMAGRKPSAEHAGIVAFQSHAEWTAARRDPRYKNDPAYRAHVEDRLRVATELGTL